MRLTSSAFSDGATIPSRYTCDGEDLSPPLDWDAASPGTRGFVILCDDRDAPAGTWHHWAAYDIHSEQTAFTEGAAQQSGQRFKHAVNDFKRHGYGGPCPPRAHGPHHYRFRLLALSIEYLSVSKDASCREVERAARKHVLVEATLVGEYQR